jgi:AcrR family transcriptional regulator
VNRCIPGFPDAGLQSEVEVVMRLDKEAGERRDQRKQRTRESLLEAALSLMKQGYSFTALSLREVTREAGVVPTAFYRHFRSMDDLGLAIVEESGLVLRRLLREARSEGVPVTGMIRKSVQIYLDYIEQNRPWFMFVVGERGGGSPLIRDAIRTEIQQFTSEMVHDLRRLNILGHLSTADLQMICGLVVNTMLNAAIDVFDLPPRQPQRERELVENFVRQLRLIFIGAYGWHAETPVESLPAVKKSKR